MTAFLIRQSLDGVPSFYSARVGRDYGTPHGWTQQAEEAMQFARERDAQAFIDTFLMHQAPFCQITPHERDS